MSSNSRASMSSTSAEPSARRVRRTRWFSAFFRTVAGVMFDIDFVWLAGSQPAHTLAGRGQCYLHAERSMRSIEREILGGWCMIAGAASGLVTMALHPTGGERAALALAVHALALFGVPLAFYGAWVLTRRLGSH